MTHCSAQLGCAGRQRQEWRKTDAVMAPAFLSSKKNFVDHTLTDQTSITRFIEDNWKLGQIGGESFDAIAGPILNVFNFDEDRDDGRAFERVLLLDPDSGIPTRSRW
jgi:hypothetical protein